MPLAVRTLAIVTIGAVLFLLPAPAARADLAAYLKKPEPAFAWKLVRNASSGAGTVYTLRLTSQTWQGIGWEHDLQVFVPKGVRVGSTLVLWNTGGKPGLGSMALGLELARKAQAPLAFLYGIPNQPLLDGKKEDALIAETFVRYLKTKDENWPLLFPMVKSLVKAMDALQAFARAEWKTEVKHFVVAGASKRGWTSWLTAAADPRVKGVAPLVIDTLNMARQLPHQLRSFGAYSEQIRDYTRRGLVPLPDTPEARRLWGLVDPWTYRERLTLPKLIVNGTNDPYWSQDALNLYWDDLKGDKWVLYVPNAGHNLQQRHADGRHDMTRAANTLATFFRSQQTGKPLPRLTWRHDEADGKFRLTATSAPAPRAARLWLAEAATRDFREATWEEQAVRLDRGSAVGTVAGPKEGYRAFFIECEYEQDGLPYYLSTQLRIVGAPKR
jgi:PhoPQ-activated pathogenicity-related protein